MVAIEPHYCHQCGAVLTTREIEGRERKQYPECERPYFRNAVPAVDVIVRDGAQVLLIERSVPPVGVWSLPGGHPEYDEKPVRTAIRELAEETGLRATPADLSLLSVRHGEYRGLHYNMIAYEVEYSETAGELDAGEEARDVAFWDVEEFLAAEDETREIDRTRMESAIME